MKLVEFCTFLRGEGNISESLGHFLAPHKAIFWGEEENKGEEAEL